MKTSTTRALWAIPMVLAGLGTLMSACGPQDGAADKGAQAQPLAAAATTQSVTSPMTPAPVAQPQALQAQPQVAKAPKPAPVRTQAKAAAPMPVADVKPSAQALATNGAVQAIEPITQANPTGAGAVVGGLLGGVVGHQFGKGDGKKAMTVVGAVGGAVAGHEVEKSQNRKVVGYRVRVQLDNGDSRTFEPTQLDGLKIGDRVRIDQGALHKA